MSCEARSPRGYLLGCRSSCVASGWSWERLSTALARCAPGVQLTVVVTVLIDPAGAQRLVAYVMPAATTDINAVLASLSGRGLPVHMVPTVAGANASHAATVTEWQDRAASTLPAARLEQHRLAEEYVAPVPMSLEAQAAGHVWQAGTGSGQRISTQADFFAIRRQLPAGRPPSQC